MNRIQEILSTQPQAKEAVALLLQWEQKAIQAYDEILLGLSNVQEELTPATFTAYLRVLYHATCIAPSEEIKKVFKEIGLRLFQLQWFIPFEQITEELYNITEDGEIKLNLYYTLFAIKSHLETKIDVDLIKWTGLTEQLNDKPFTTKTKKDLYNLIRKRRYSGGGELLNPKGEYERQLNELIEEMNRAIGDPKLAEKMLLQLSDGNTKKTFLKMIVESAETKDRNDKFYRRFFGLFRLICPDMDLMSEEEFERCTTAKGEKSPYLEKSYKEYQAKRVRDIIR